MLSHIEAYLHAYLPQNLQQAYRGLDGIHRVQYCLNLLGNPQHRYQVFHVAGTSGKGSTCSYLAAGLQSQGYKVGLTLSPHLRDVRERFVIDGHMIDSQSLWDILQSLDRAIQQTNTQHPQSLTYFEICIISALQRFATQGVDMAVIETGLGGRYDASNALDMASKVCILTDIGLDHTDILGHTLSEITYQKAMIAHLDNHVFAHQQGTEIDTMIDDTVASQGAHLHRLCFEHDVELTKLGYQTDFVYHYRGTNYQTCVYGGRYQVRNAHIALQVIRWYQDLVGHSTHINTLHHALSQTQIKGRNMHLLLGEQTVWLDGAHNPQKMSAYLDYISHLNQDGFHFLLAFKQGKDWKEMLDLLMPYARHYTFLHINDLSLDQHIHFVSPQTLQEYCTNSMGKSAVGSTIGAIQDLHNHLQTSTHQAVLTGSLYLIGSVLHCWEQDYGCAYGYNGDTQLIS